MSAIRYWRFTVLFGIGISLLFIPEGDLSAQTLPSSTSAASSSTPSSSRAPSSVAQQADSGLADANAQLPVNHPPISASLPADMPKDRVEPSTLVPEGVVQVSLVDLRGLGVDRTRVELVRHSESVPSGKSVSKQVASSDSEGKALFSNLEINEDTRYRVVIDRDGARYGTLPFKVTRGAGTRVVIHVYPSVSSLEETGVASRSFLFLEPRDEVVQVEVYTEIQNLGMNVWVPTAIDLRLPESSKAFATNMQDPDVGIEQTSTGVRLVGAVAPGQHNVFFSYQIPNDNQPWLALGLPLWPRTAEVRVATVSRPGLSLDVEGFAKPEVVQSVGQKPLVLTGRTFVGRDTVPPREVRITLSGLPVIGIGRWVAAALAAILVLAGVASAVRGRGEGKNPAGRATDELARTRLLDELTDLEVAHRAGQVGDGAFEEMREPLIAACVRLERNSSS